jgi:tetratricopeptide (TPR) repeat protein
MTAHAPTNHYQGFILRSHRILAAGVLLCLALQSQALADNSPGTAARDNEAEQMQLVNVGARLLQEHKPSEAIDGLDKVIGHYEAKNTAKLGTAYCARDQAESLFYLLQAAKEKTAAVVYGRAWCDAYYLRAYALIELGRNGEARASLERAVHMSPRNAHYLSELAELYAREKNWNEALATFDASAKIAEETEPQEQKSTELGRALRGKGFVLVELGRLEEAGAIYRKCLEIDSADTRAMNELRYVQSRRQHK